MHLLIFGTTQFSVGETLGTRNGVIGNWGRSWANLLSIRSFRCVLSLNNFPEAKTSVLSDLL